MSVEVGEKMANIGKNIKKFRMQKNMTQESWQKNCLSAGRRFRIMKIINLNRTLRCW